MNFWWNGLQSKIVQLEEISNSLLGSFLVGPHLLARHRFEVGHFTKKTLGNLEGKKQKSVMHDAYRAPSELSS